MLHSTRPAFWAKLVGVPLLLVTSYAYYFWYKMLVARGYGYLYNAMKYSAPFRQARFILLIALFIGLVTYGLTRRFLTRAWRISYVIVLGLGIALFVVDWIVHQFGTTPWWHH